MISTTTASCCPDCGCTRVIDAGRGLTCTACGLVIDETPSFVVSDQCGKEGVISSHSVLHANTTTLIGAIGERGAGDGARLSRIQQRTVSYQGAKESRVYHLVSAATANAQLPAIIIDHAVHAARKIAALAPKGSSMAGPAMTSALAVFVACKKLGITRARDEWLAMAASLGIEPKPFLRNLMRLRALGKAPGGGDARQGAMAGGATVVNAALAALRDAAGPGDHLPVVRLVHAGIARALVGMREDSAAAVTAFLAGQLLSPAGVPLTLLAKTTKFRAASMYNAVKRVLAKIGVVIEGPLSKARLGVVLRSRVLVGGGVVKEVPVPVEAALPVIEAAAATEASIPDKAAEVVTCEVPEPITSNRPAPAMQRAAPCSRPPSRPRGRKPMSHHVVIAPTLLVVAARGNALRLLEHVHPSRLPKRRIAGTAGPPSGTIATGLGPPVPVAAVVFDGG